MDRTSSFLSLTASHIALTGGTFAWVGTQVGSGRKTIKAKKDREERQSFIGKAHHVQAFGVHYYVLDTCPAHLRNTHSRLTARRPFVCAEQHAFDHIKQESFSTGPDSPILNSQRQLRAA